MDLSAEIARFGDILIIEGSFIEPGPVRFLAIRQSVSGSSQRGRVRARPEPAGPGAARSVGRENGGQRDVGARPRFPRASNWVAPFALTLSVDLLAGWG